MAILKLIKEYINICGYNSYNCVNFLHGKFKNLNIL
jgi:hypothetical protein